jgi:serine/threonine protein kinase
MAIRGEARQKTYRGFQAIAKGIVVAHHEILGENCIQKTYEPAGRDDAIAFAEPRLLNELDHRYITPIREAQYDPDRPGCVTIVMRVYDGGSIYDTITKTGYRFSTGTAMTVIQHTAEALAYLHGEKGYVYRDVNRRTSFSTATGLPLSWPTLVLPPDSIPTHAPRPSCLRRLCTRLRRVAGRAASDLQQMSTP